MKGTGRRKNGEGLGMNGDGRRVRNEGSTRGGGVRG